MAVLKKTTKTVKDIEKEKSLVKSYTVKFLESNKKKSVTFNNLLDAREFAINKHREGSFEVLHNGKGTVLPLGRYKKQEVVD
tara:strand:- start:653 stop:898 length:246 start_codon:yes stop_codon:yes gene_type:complete